MGIQGDSDVEIVQLQQVVSSQGHLLQDKSTLAASQTWLKPQLESAEGTRKVYTMMESMVARPSFLQTLTDALQRAKSGAKQSADSEAISKPDVTQPEFWEDVQVPEDPEDQAERPFEFEAVTPERQTSVEPLDSYVLVEKEDVLEAIGTFVAAYLVELPEAQNLKPGELQDAVKRAFKELRQSRFRRFWGWGRCIYRCAALSYGAFSVYTNPWLVRAVLAAMWTASKLMVGLLF